MSEIFIKFKEAMMSHGITPPVDIIADDEIHRFSTNGKRCNTDGWYVFYADGIPTGCYGDWKKNLSFTWCAKSKNQMSIDERNKLSLQLEIVQKNRKEAKYLEQRQAAKKAQGIWDSSMPADPHHPYLIKKRVLPFWARQRGDSLVLPVLDFDEQIWSLQFITPEGTKKLLKGGAKKGRFIYVNGFLSNSQKLICEGFATGATLAQLYPDAYVIAAIDAGNLEYVAVEARNRWPNAEILICGDDDRLTPGNPGATKARIAAIAAKAKYTIPQWPEGAPEYLSDFNDLACWLSDNSWGRYE